MSPLEQIKQGILKGDWEIVIDGYRNLTGELLYIDTNSNTTVAMRQIYDIAAKTLNTCLPETTNYQLAEGTIIKHIPTKKKKKRRLKSGNKRGDVTVDDEDASLQLDTSKRTVVQRETGGTQLITNEPDPEEVKKNKIKAVRSQKNKTKLDRQTIKIYDVKCNECEQTFKSNRRSGKMGQKCSKCLQEKKSRFA